MQRRSGRPVHRIDRINDLIVKHAGDLASFQSSVRSLTYVLPGCHVSYSSGSLFTDGRVGRFKHADWMAEASMLFPLMSMNGTLMAHSLCDLDAV